MAKASTLIMRNMNGSQLASGNQVWVIQATDATQYEVGFDKEFVKKHLFVDPDPPVDIQAKATGLVNKINTYGHLAEAVPANLNAATLRFLKMKKLVLTRTVQGTCSICHEKETQHELICDDCDHKHKKPWSGGGACGDSGTCTCPTWNPVRGGLPAGHAKICAGFTVNDYETARALGGKLNPFGGPGGACTGTNTVILMDEIDLVTFKDVVVAAIKAAQPWNVNEKKEGVALQFGPGTAVTIESDDDQATFDLRAKGKGINVDVVRRNDVYKIYHYRSVIP